MSKINEVLDVAADAVDEIGPVKALKKVWDKVVSNKIKNVFKNCAKQLNLSGNIEQEFKEKLDKYTGTDFGQETVYSLVQKSISSESKECCKVIGILLGRAMLENRPLNQAERTMAEALKSMTDYDLSLLVGIHSTISYLPIKIHPDIIKRADGDEQIVRKATENNSVDISDFFIYKLIAGDKNEAYYSVERMKGLNVLTANARYEGVARINTNGLLRITPLSSYLVDLAKCVI
jgi:hypothetical protein